MPRTRTKKQKGNKKVAYHLIDRDTVTGRPMYQQLRELVRAHHPHLEEARIALAFCTSWKQDVDGHTILGKMKKASELDRELAAFDFIMLLRRAFWEDLLVSREQKVAVMDHELCHGAPACDARTGEQLRDERGRLLWRIKKHDLEEFSEVVERHGLYKRDIEVFYAAARRAAFRGFEPCSTCKDTPQPGYTVRDDGRLERCACWTAWQARVADAQPAGVAV